ncbi:hypothetical protein MB27_38755 [Actinoplanes utahensis]|uniref:Uncharacterized protein n=1 Tax=Actinoplanes utahensis TaxID=1869 RepID=A0A0A6UBG9_ACTUT|nr:hypothetical protein MB27_38755 [Actinoplanes utahensis]
MAQQMADDVTALESTVAGPDNPWGGDESGSVFALAYQGVLGHALQALGSYVQEMGEAALTLTAQARAIAATDTFSAASLASPALTSEPAASLASPALTSEPAASLTSPVLASDGSESAASLADPAPAAATFDGSDSAAVPAFPGGTT